jgi:hypothetical protein
MNLGDLGFAEITPPNEKSKLKESFDETTLIYERLSRKEISVKEAVGLLREKRERLGLPPIVLNKN